MANLDELKKKIVPLLEDQSLTWTDLEAAMKLMEQVANDSDDFKEDYEDFTATYQFEVTDKPEAEWMWLKIVNGKFEAGRGKVAKYDLKFTMDSKLAADMISGAVDSNSAFMQGKLKLDGPIKLGVKFQGIMALFKDVLDI
jgi:putative sterol carrier protein